MSGLKDIEVLQLVVELKVCFSMLCTSNSGRQLRVSLRKLQPGEYQGYGCVLGSLHSLQHCCGVQQYEINSVFVEKNNSK